MPPLILLSPRARFTLLTPPLLSSISRARRHTGTSDIRDVHSDAFNLLLPQPTPLLLLSTTRAHIPLPMPPPWSPITQDCHRDNAASVFVPKSLTHQSLSPIPCTCRVFFILWWPLSLSLIPHAFLTLSTLPPLSSIPWFRKNISASTVGNVHLDAFSLLRPKPMHMFLLSRPWDHLPLLMPLLWYPIPQEYHCDAAAYVVDSKYRIPQTNYIFLVIHWCLWRCCWFCRPVSKRLLTSGLLTSYLLCWRFALVTAGL